MDQKERKLEQSWVANAEAWTQSVREKQIASRKLATDGAILNEITSLNPKKVLDVGCGEGWLARALCERGIQVTGFDGSSALIDKALESGGGDFLHMSYEAFAADPIQVGNNFGVAVCNFSLLSSDLTAILRGLSVVLAPDGVIIIHTLHPFNLSEQDRYEDGWREETFSGMGEGYTSPMPWYFRTMGSWLKELRNSGLKLVDCKEPIHPTTGKPLSLMLMAKGL